MGLENERFLIFAYGTLKRGFPNHNLMQDLMQTNDATFLGVYRTVEKYPLVCGPYGVPFLLNLPNSGDSNSVLGELYAVSEIGLSRMDELEGTSRNHYERLAVEVVKKEGNNNNVAVVKAEGYFGHRSFAGELWKKSGEKGLCEYDGEAAKGYVKRSDRPANISFVDMVWLFINSPSSSSS
ncbi:hypothetical protein IFM89_012840 [Coptis chinensis]|uniref:Gamma-glutamylcyclotransferase family protein n=1 Tax=Coptis chinensis TaxID=261450 RepID=A0A835IWN4_9MAGN|nr:hypothetical protein IFM89_012840 [Coptis chinensis]